MEQLCSLLFEVSNEDRLRILLQLDQEGMTITRLSEELDMTTQESSRHVARLTKVGLTEKKVDGFQHLTAYGKLVLTHLPALQFISKHRDYFTSHSLTHLPIEFKSRVGELADSTYTDDVLVFFHNVAMTIQRAEEHIWLILDQFIMSHVAYAKDAIERHVNMKTIEPREWIAPVEFYRIREKDEEWVAPARQKGLLQNKTLEKIEIYLFITEKEAAFAFPVLDGSFDHRGFISKNKQVIKWCRDMFNYYWERAEPLHKPLSDYAS
jgi:predicted transcriptional regulator